MVFPRLQSIVLCANFISMLGCVVGVFPIFLFLFRLTTSEVDDLSQSGGFLADKRCVIMQFILLSILSLIIASSTQLVCCST